MKISDPILIPERWRLVPPVDGPNGGSIKSMIVVDTCS